LWSVYTVPLEPTFSAIAEYNQTKEASPAAATRQSGIATSQKNCLCIPDSCLPAGRLRAPDFFQKGKVSFSGMFCTLVQSGGAVCFGPTLLLHYSAILFENAISPMLYSC